MKMKNYKKITTSVIYSGLTLSLVFPFIEPTTLLAQSASDTVKVTLTVDAGIAISAPADVTMAPNLGISANSSIGTAMWNVKTNDGDGYTLSVKSDNVPAMHSATYGINDYTPATPGTPDVWNVPAGSIEFGYSAYGSDVTTSQWGTGATCGSTGVPLNTLKYAGLSTTNFTIATKNATTTTSGVNTTICFAAEQDTTFAAADVYTANVIATATVQ